MRNFIAIGWVAVTLAAVSAPARAGDEAAAFVLGTLVGSALADNGHGKRLVVSHHSHPAAHRYSRSDLAYARGYRDAKRSLRYAPPPKAWRHGYRNGYRHGPAYGHRYDWRSRPYTAPRPLVREIYRQGYRDARRDVRRAERRQERRQDWRADRREQRNAELRDRGREIRQGGRPSRHEERRRH